MRRARSLHLAELALASGSDKDRQAAIGHLADNLEENADAPHRDVLWLLVALAFIKSPSPLTDAQADRLLRMAAKALRLPDLPREEAALWHALNAQAYYVRATGSRRLDEIELALASLRTAQELLPEGHDLRGPLTLFTSVILYYRFLGSGSLVDGDAATAYLRAVNELAGPERQDPVTEFLGALSAIGIDPSMRRARHAAGAAPLIARLRQALATLPENSKDRYGAMAALGAILLAQADLTGPQAEEGLNLLTQAASQASRDNPYYTLLNDSAALWQGRVGSVTRNAGLIDEAIRRVSEPVARPGLLPGERLRRAQVLATLLGDRYMLSRKPRDLDRSIEILARCLRFMDSGPGWRRAAMLLDLAENYRIRGLRLLRDHRRAIKTGMAGLREAAADVILQTGARRGLDSARGVQSWAGLVAAWCLVDDHPDQAVRALELGRSLVLHAATVAADIPGLLRMAGHDDLAGRWRREAGHAPALFDISPADEDETAYLSGLLGLSADEGIPSDVRRQVLAALGDTAAITDAPSAGDLAAALPGAGYDAFAYLLPPDPAVTRDGGPRPGCALMVRADGHVQEIPLPRLSAEPVAAYDAAHQAWIANPDDLSRTEAWNRALEALCDWAWEAMAGPVLSHVAGWGLPRPPRLVLVPTGNLGMVPWHAARTAGPDGTPHYAIQDAVFGYAASARQLISAARRPHKPWASRPMLLADTAGDLPMAALEARELRRLFYPDAEVGATNDVLAALPGGDAAPASLLHCCCHASVRGDLSSSFLQLAGGQRLTVAQVMAQAQGRDPEAPGYLAVLSACTSDLADVDHDEALTLASALLAAGASGVVGTRWPAGDLPAAELMVAFHHFLNRGDASPADALRAAQLWMLGPHRGALEDLSPHLASQVAARRLGQVRNWAAFTYHGIAAP